MRGGGAATGDIHGSVAFAHESGAFRELGAANPQEVRGRHGHGDQASSADDLFHKLVHLLHSQHHDRIEELSFYEFSQRQHRLEILCFLFLGFLGIFLHGGFPFFSNLILPIRRKIATFQFQHSLGLCPDAKLACH